MQTVLDMHVTLLSDMFVSGDAPAGLGVRWIFHSLPFQRSTSAACLGWTNGLKGLT
jgi:hypothetical protein